MYEIKGTVKEVGELERFESGFEKRKLTITTEEQYPQPIQLDFIKDKIALLENVANGTQVEVGFYLRGKEYKGRVFHDLVAFKLEVK